MQTNYYTISQEERIALLLSEKTDIINNITFYWSEIERSLNEVRPPRIPIRVVPNLYTIYANNDTTSIIRNQHSFFEQNRAYSHTHWNSTGNFGLNYATESRNDASLNVNVGYTRGNVIEKDQHGFDRNYTSLLKRGQSNFDAYVATSAVATSASARNAVATSAVATSKERDYHCTFGRSLYKSENITISNLRDTSGRNHDMPKRNLDTSLQIFNSGMKKNTISTKVVSEDNIGCFTESVNASHSKVSSKTVSSCARPSFSSVSSCARPSGVSKGSCARPSVSSCARPSFSSYAASDVSSKGNCARPSVSSCDRPSVSSKGGGSASKGSCATTSKGSCATTSKGSCGGASKGGGGSSKGAGSRK